MIFQTAQDVREWAERAAAADFARYLSSDYGKNPYCTQGARGTWQRGYEGAPPRSWEGNLAFDTQYQRGAAMRRIMAGLQDIRV